MVEILKSRFNYLLAYGVLRKGQHLYEFYKDIGSIEHIETTKIYGYNLYSLGPYPAVTRDLKLSTGLQVICDLIKCDSETFNIITKLHKDYGFEEQMVIMGDLFTRLEVSPSLFVFRAKISDTKRISSGDWVKYKQDLKNESTKEKTESLIIGELF